MNVLAYLLVAQMVDAPMFDDGEDIRLYIGTLGQILPVVPIVHECFHDNVFGYHLVMHIGMSKTDETLPTFTEEVIKLTQIHRFIVFCKNNTNTIRKCCEIKF